MIELKQSITKETHRNLINVELDPQYFNIAKQRILK